ncbi:hypothetical protein WR25_06674 [Diploscapter pachys]|uniref:Uncharacterized protein n=1 Tax=Diploscapter pachys TaxID=2018661 RepID=A0A2A2K0P5_9BILA|nr:hypothetical protein WR25_06674 [Diploscapter pachys]
MNMELSVSVCLRSCSSGRVCSFSMIAPVGRRVGGPLCGRMGDTDNGSANSCMVFHLSPFFHPILRLTSDVCCIQSLCACRSRVLDLSVALYSLYVSRRRSPSFSTLLTASSQLLIKFSQILFYTRYKTLRVDVSAHFENWLKYLVEVLSCDTWPSEMQNKKCDDLSVRIELLRLLINLYTSSANFQSEDASSPQPTSTSREPPFSSAEVAMIENKRIFEKSCRAVWIGLTMDTGNCVTEHVKMAEVLMRLHARKAGEPSSDVENMIASSLANTNPYYMTD